MPPQPTVSGIRGHLAPWQPFHGSHPPRLRPPVVVPAADARLEVTRHPRKCVRSPHPALDATLTNTLRFGRATAVEKGAAYRNALQRISRPPSRSSSATLSRPASAPSLGKASRLARPNSATHRVSAAGSTQDESTKNTSLARLKLHSRKATRELEAKTSKEQDHEVTRLLARLEALAFGERCPANSDVEELIERTVRRGDDLEDCVRVRAFLALARLLSQDLSEESGGAMMHERAELEGAIVQHRQLLLADPPNALQLAELCEDKLGLIAAADTIYDILEEDALWGPASPMHAYIFVDLAERHLRQGRLPQCRYLFQKARDVPDHLRDPRTWSRHYLLRLDSEPSVPLDELRVDNPMSVSAAGAVRRGREGEEARVWRPSAGPLSTPPLTTDDGTLANAWGELGERPPVHVREVLARQFGMASGLAGVGRAPGHDVASLPTVRGRSASCAVGGACDTPAHGRQAAAASAQKLSDAESTAWQMVRARRFRWRIVDSGAQLEVPSPRDSRKTSMLEGTKSRCVSAEDVLAPCAVFPQATDSH